MWQRDRCSSRAVVWHSNLPVGAFQEGVEMSRIVLEHLIRPEALVRVVDLSIRADRLDPTRESILFSEEPTRIGMIGGKVFVRLSPEPAPWADPDESGANPTVVSDTVAEPVISVDPRMVVECVELNWKPTRLDARKEMRSSVRPRWAGIARRQGWWSRVAGYLKASCGV
jgi:hypothetical protein